MSELAIDLFELKRLMRVAGGALTYHLLCEVAARLISAGLRSDLGGC